MPVARASAHGTLPVFARRILPLLILLGALSTATPVVAAKRRSAATTNYRITASYDPASHVIEGRETIEWTNRSTEAATELQLHLYLNAFANNRSTFFREFGPRVVDDWIAQDPEGWGAMTISELRIGEHHLTGRIQFIHPDDDNDEDRTVIQVLLPTPLPAGETTQIDIAFVTKLPLVFMRSGYAGSFTMAAQWFPKLGVFERGKWVCHQYHANGEFYANFGVYDVTLTLPGTGHFGSTGALEEERLEADGRRTVRIRAENVHDFAWTHDTDFVTLERQIDGVTVRLLLQRNHANQEERFFRAVSETLRWYRDHIAAYPYSQLTVVDPGPGADAAGGMEYPQLITTGTRAWIPERLRIPEVLTVHELGHQFWYGVIASNETEEAWLDEGINTYVESLIMDERFGPASYANLFGLRIGAVPLLRLQYLRSSQHDALSQRSWMYRDRRSYSSISYAKTALLLRTLDGLWSNGVIERTLRTYYSRYRFAHPRSDDFLAVLAEVSGKDLGWIRQELVDGTGSVDYAVTRVVAERDKGFRGLPIGPGGPGPVIEPSLSDAERFRSEVIIERLGEVALPVNVLINFDDGSNVNEHWDGASRWKRFEYAGPQRVEWAVVDPEHSLALDVNWLNNSRMRGSGSRGLTRIIGRWMFWFQNVLHFLGAM